MLPSDPDIVLSYEGRVPDEIIENFKALVATEGLNLIIDERLSTRAYAGVQWLMPTVIAAYIAKPYFESFLTEAGKDHYNLVKKGAKAIAQKVRAITLTRLGTPGKVKPQDPYSPVFSIYCDKDGGGKIKFLIPGNVSEADMETAMEAGLNFIEDYRWKRVEASLFADVSEQPRTGSITLVAYDPQTKKVSVIDPFKCLLPPNGNKED